MTSMASGYYLNDRELAARLGVSYRTVHNWRANDPSRLPRATNIGSAKGPRWRTSIKDLDAFMEERATLGQSIKRREAVLNTEPSLNQTEKVRRVEDRIKRTMKKKEQQYE